ncbi:MAG TPA: hypothetical protein VHG51_09225 [Longimicrobiaceae bacterium]|nr:hypothetical protein [Longimicrobiaceae bacterium]
MSPQQEDYLLRMIRLAFQVVQRLRARLLGGPAEAEEVVREARDAQAQLLGPLAGTAALLDADTAVGLLRDRERLAAWAELLRVEAEAHRALGDDARAEALERRADAIVDACGRLLE